MTEDDVEIYTVYTTAKQIPIKWTAPEALTHMTYVLATDVWAFGILLWEIFSCGKMPYPGMTNTEAKEKVINHGYRMDPPAGTPDQVSQLMDECWQHNEQDRPTMADICDYNLELKAFYPDEAGTGI
jgi:serine/threonine protein kinase